MTIDWEALEVELYQLGPSAGLPRERRPFTPGTAAILLRSTLPADLWLGVLSDWVADYRRARRWS